MKSWELSLKNKAIKEREVDGDGFLSGGLGFSIVTSIIPIVLVNTLEKVVA